MINFSVSLFIICFFTFLIHLTESLAYSMRLAGVRTRQIAVSMAFVTSTLLVSRLSNMLQAPLLGAMVDSAILEGTNTAIYELQFQFRVIIFSAFLGAFFGMFLTPTFVQLFRTAILQFKERGSFPIVILHALRLRNLIKIMKSFKCPRVFMFKRISIKSIPKSFLIFNIAVTSIYVIGVLCSLLAGAYFPEFRSTAIQLSGIVNGMATVMFTLFVDPSGARITDQAVNGQCAEDDVRSVVFFMQCGKLLGTLIIAQILLLPLSYYILWVTKLIRIVYT